MIPPTLFSPGFSPSVAAPLQNILLRAQIHMGRPALGGFVIKAEGINGVYDLDGRGVKPILTEADETLILECLEIDPRSLRTLDAMVIERTGKTASLATYRRNHKEAL